MKINQLIRKAHITVNKDVVKHLSLGLYRNFALAIKELISNSYDAGATEVKLKLDMDSGKIILRDNGRGMDENEFKNDYLNIGLFKEPSREIDELGRWRIGTFGVGFLAPLPYCQTLKIITKKRGNELTLEGEIRANDFFTKGNWEISNHDVEYKLYESDLSPEEGETIIVLEDIKGQIFDELSRETHTRRTIEGSGYEKFKWTLAQYCPIEYPTRREDLSSFFGVGNRVPMKLWVDGDRLYRNVPEKAKILEKDTKKFGEINLKYVIMTPFEPVQPEEMRGLQVRLKDVAIGFPRDFEVTKLGRNLGKLNMLCGEIHILEGLDNSLLVNRESFNYTEDVAEIYGYFRTRLTYWNDTLYNWADDDKELYLALGDLRDDERIIADLNKSDLLHFSKERLRLSEGMLRKSKSKTVENPIDSVVRALSKKTNNQIINVVKNLNVNPKIAAIKLEKDQKTITIYENHPAFVETIEFEGETFKVHYDEWDPSETPFRICRLSADRTTAIFNKANPLFKSKLNDTIVKHLAMGILMILNDVEVNEVLIEKFNELLEDIFTEQ